ncbi:hypothetical protein PV646_28745 [Streptomyces sp. ID05-26A]|nr:hypothetical protein [Streptomyces sp. ID05-26A]
MTSFQYSPHAGSAAIHPSWVMSGAQIAPDHVILLASKDLSQADLEMHADEELGFPWYTGTLHWPPRREYILSTTMNSFVRIEAASWPAAFEALFQRWTPDTGQPHELATTLALPGS